MVFPNEAKIIDPKLHHILQYTCTYVCFETAIYETLLVYVFQVVSVSSSTHTQSHTHSHTLIIINTIINLCFLGPLEHYPQSIHTTMEKKRTIRHRFYKQAVCMDYTYATQSLLKNMTLLHHKITSKYFSGNPFS